MKDRSGKVIYVGKAKNLKNRVKQYFQNQDALAPKVKMMVSRINGLETIVTSSELEAFILERNLIKKHRPQFNNILKDDKNYPLIKITVTDEYPRILMTRRVDPDGAGYFGPFTNTAVVKEMLELISSIYPLKACAKKISAMKSKERPCINHQIGRCLAPCQGNVDRESYMKMVRDIYCLLDGKTDRVIKKLEHEMQTHSNDLEFEKARDCRDKISAVRNITDKQNISLTKAENGDFIACYGDDTCVCLQVFFLRGRNITGRSMFFFDRPFGKDTGEIISDFIIQYYDTKKIIPNRIYVSELPDSSGSLEEYLKGIRDRPVRIIRPLRGEKKGIIDMALENAQIGFDKTTAAMIEREGFFERAKEGIKKYLLIDRFERVEAFDISNTSRDDIVAAMIVFEDSGFDRKSYRKYIIRDGYGINDYMAVAEAVRRRYRHLVPGNKGDINGSGDDSPLLIKPDAILVDGGMGHVNTVKKVLDELGLDISVIGMVKDKKHQTRGLVYEDDYFDLRNEILLLRFMTLIQNEVHRSASSFNRKKMKGRVLSSELDRIPGIGSVRKKKLLKKYGSIDKILESTDHELAKTLGTGIGLASAVKEELKKTNGDICDI